MCFSISPELSSSGQESLLESADLHSANQRTEGEEPQVANHEKNITSSPDKDVCTMPAHKLAHLRMENADSFDMEEVGRFHGISRVLSLSQQMLTLFPIPKVVQSLTQFSQTNFHSCCLSLWSGCDEWPLLTTCSVVFHIDSNQWGWSSATQNIQNRR